MVHRRDLECHRLHGGLKDQTTAASDQSEGRPGLLKIPHIVNKDHVVLLNPQCWRKNAGRAWNVTTCGSALNLLSGVGVRGEQSAKRGTEERKKRPVMVRRAPALLRGQRSHEGLILSTNWT